MWTHIHENARTMHPLGNDHPAPPLLQTTEREKQKKGGKTNGIAATIKCIFQVSKKLIDFQFVFFLGFDSFALVDPVAVKVN